MSFLGGAIGIFKGLGAIGGRKFFGIFSNIFLEGSGTVGGRESFGMTLLEKSGGR